MSGREFLLCFVDFENVLQSTIALNTLQDYRFDKHDKHGLKISYAKDFKDVVKEKSTKKYRWSDSTISFHYSAKINQKKEGEERSFKGR